MSKKDDHSSKGLHIAMQEDALALSTWQKHWHLSLVVLDSHTDNLTAIRQDFCVSNNIKQDTCRSISKDLPYDFRAYASGTMLHQGWYYVSKHSADKGAWELTH